MELLGFRPFHFGQTEEYESIPGRNRVDEFLVPLGMRTLAHRQRLTVCGPSEGLRPQVWNPDLNGTKTRLAQPGAVRADLIAGSRSIGSWHLDFPRKLDRLKSSQMSQVFSPARSAGNETRAT